MCRLTREHAKVTELDVEKKTVALASGETFKYDGCLVATGGMYVSPPPPP
jgi:NADPH-dependent 2,4-dienoyl-CoA reductase/sulfur reductase-like enzyme